MKLGKYNYEEFLERVKEFHGTVAPGIVLGAYIVTCGLEKMPEGTLIDIICETKTCLPDAVQLLTPCSYGNGWLKILDYGKFSAIFYDKYTGEGVRVKIDGERIGKWQELNDWFYKIKPKHEQNINILLSQINEASCSVFKFEKVKVDKSYLGKKKMGSTGICSSCGESYPLVHGEKCRGCQIGVPYTLEKK